MMARSTQESLPILTGECENTTAVSVEPNTPKPDDQLSWRGQKNIRTGQRCNDCGQTYSAVFYSIKRETKNQHTCGGFGIFVMSASEYRNSQQVKNLLSQWSGKVMLSGDGIPNNA